MIANERTKVIVRIDDITPGLLETVAEWFLEYHPDVPVSGFAVSTGKWETTHWKCAAHLIRNRGWEFCAHTRNHDKLPMLKRDEITEVISRSIKDIESGLADMGLDYTVESFAYPGGLHDDRAVDVLSELGIENGLVFSDGLPYRSAVRVPDGPDRLRWGTTNNGSFGLDVWNNKFDRTHETGDCYVLCLHPQRWQSVFRNLISLFQSDTNCVASIRQITELLLWGSFTEQWTVLGDHLDYIKSHSAVKFTTFRGATAET